MSQKLKMLAFAVGLLIAGVAGSSTGAGSWIPGRYERFEKYDSREAAIGAAAKALSGHQAIESWEFCPSAGETRRFVLVGHLQGMNAEGFANVRQVSDGWRVQMRHVFKDPVKDGCEKLDQTAVLAWISKAAD